MTILNSVEIDTLIKLLEKEILQETKYIIPLEYNVDLMRKLKKMKQEMKKWQKW